MLQKTPWFNSSSVFFSMINPILYKNYDFWAFFNVNKNEFQSKMEIEQLIAKID